VCSAPGEAETSQYFVSSRTSPGACAVRWAAAVPPQTGPLPPADALTTVQPSSPASNDESTPPAARTSGDCAETRPPASAIRASAVSTQREKRLCRRRISDPNWPVIWTLMCLLIR
jgi:hypothetical protein